MLRLWRGSALVVVESMGRIKRKQSSTRKFKCGCRITKGVLESAFEVFACDYHIDKLNMASWSLSEIESKIQSDQIH